MWEENGEFVPPDILEEANSATFNLLPQKSKDRFQQTVSVIRNGLTVLCDVKEKAPFKANWPGTAVEIPESDCDVLIRLLNALKKLCPVFKKMDHGDVYQSDECESDDTVAVQDEEDNAYSLSETAGNVAEGIINQNELLNKSENTKHIQQIEDIANPNEVKTPASLLNVGVPEFVPRNLKINSSRVNYNPVIKYMPVLNSAPETLIPTVSEDKTNCAPKIKSVIDNNTTQSSQHHAEGYQTIAMKMIEKSIDIFTQTPKSEQEICNCKQQREIKDQLFKEQLSAVMDENKKLREKVENLQEENKQKEKTLEEYKQKLLEKQQEILVAENVAQIASIKLEAHQEGWQDKRTELEGKINDQKNKTDKLRKNNEIMHSVIATQTMQYFNLQQHVLTDHLNKCRRMEFDLTAAFSYLTVTSIPTAADCHKHIEKWQKELKKAEHCSALLKDCYKQITKDLHLGNFTDIPNLPELFTQLTEHNDVLHDSFMPAVNTLLKENARYYQHNLQFQRWYSEWWNTFGRSNQLRPAIITASPQFYDVPQGSLDVQIGADTASSAAKNSVAVTTPNTYFKFTTDHSNTSKKPEITEAIAQSVTDNSKLSEASNAPESSTPQLNSVMGKAEVVKHHKTVKFVDDDSNASKEDEKSFVCKGISDINVENVKIKETANSDNSTLEQKSSDALSIDSEQNVSNETKPLVSFTITSKKAVLQRSILDETEQESTLTNVLTSCMSSQPSDSSSNDVPLLNLKQTKSLDNASSLATAETPVEDLAVAQPTKVDSTKQGDHNISEVFHFHGELNGSQIQAKQHSFSFSLTETYKTSPSNSHKVNDDHSAAPTDHLTPEISSITPVEAPKIIDYSQLPEAVRKAGRSFCDLYLYVKDRVPEKTETEILSALKKVRRKNTKLSGMTRDAIVAAVRIELKINQENVGYLDASASALPVVNSEVAGLIKNRAQAMCVVCYETFGDVPLTELPCQHTFHRKCITQWFIYKNDCPVCRIFVV